MLHKDSFFRSCLSAVLKICSEMTTTVLYKVEIFFLVFIHVARDDGDYAPETKCRLGTLMEAKSEKNTLEGSCELFSRGIISCF